MAGRFRVAVVTATPVAVVVARSRRLHRVDPEWLYDSVEQPLARGRGNRQLRHRQLTWSVTVGAGGPAATRDPPSTLRDRVPTMFEGCACHIEAAVGFVARY